ncbi:MAG: 3-phosphoglycerate dehydrogenase, partial [Bacteroidales bacterium]|nr:3-phosphoglycerate dehydrogenase [Bacteroidales bacterium]
MRKVLIATEKPFAKDAVDAMKAVADKAGYELSLLEKYTEKQELIDAVAKAEAVIIRSDIIDAEVMANANDLKIVVRAGAGYDNVDLAAASEKGIVVMNTPGQNSNAVAELVFGMLLNLVRSGFDGASGSELRG